MKNIAILTLGLKCNYGGILQAAALYNFLEKEGYNPILLRKYPIQKAWKNFVIKFFERLPFQNFRGFRVENIKYNNNISFFELYMPNKTEIMIYKSQIEEFLNTSDIEAIIVGSDQVWRYTYINDTQYDTYFLNFNLNKKIKKISYAASFGVEKWEAPHEKQNVRKYLLDFDSISVREGSGKQICKNDFDRDDVELVLDPTLLIDQSFYLDMIKNCKQENYDCVTYILDNTVQKNELVNKISLSYQYNNIFNLLNDNSILSVPDWVASFKSTNFVITDSFHGMVFSIIFNKQFFVFINEDRGADRFYSLCSILGLTERLIKSHDLKFNPSLYSEIDYNLVNSKIEILRCFSKDFLLNSINDIET